MKNILKYLRRTKNLFLIFGGDLSCELRSILTQTLCLILMIENLLQDTCSFVMVVQLAGRVPSNPMESTTEAEYVVALDDAKKGFWFKKFVAKLRFMTSDAILLYCDNNGAIALTKKPRFHKKFKHIERYFHIICDYLKKKHVKVQRVDSADNVADLLTKQLS